MFSRASTPQLQPLNPESEGMGRMIRATFIAVALAVGYLSSEAQNPTPAPAPVPPSPEVKPAQPTPSPKARRTPVVPQVWQSDDLTDLQFKLDALKDLDFDLMTPPIPP